MTSSLTLGVDPGSPGAAVFLRSASPRPRLALALRWSANRRGYLLRGYRPGGEGLEETQLRGVDSALGDAILTGYRSLCPLGAAAPRLRLACEDVFAHPKNARTAIVLARMTGCLMTRIEIASGEQTAYTLASSWRAQLLRLRANTPREQAKRASLQYLPPLIEGLEEALQALGRYDHVTDAAGVALWRARQ